MKLLLDFFPIILFFGAYKVSGIYVATAVAIAATVAQLAYMRVKTGKTEPMQWISLAIIVVFVMLNCSWLAIIGCFTDFFSSWICMGV